MVPYVSSFYYTSRKNKCELFTFFQDKTPERKSLLSPPNNFHCNNGQTISDALINDLVIDCEDPQEDEALLVMLFKNHTRFYCPQPDQLPCRTGHPRCFNVSEICTFKLNTLGYSIPCRNGEHLQSCTKFECNMKFHCPGYYCIPWSYVCDGKWDCPRGSDESIIPTCIQRNCTNMFKCRSSQICIHLSDICNKEIDCPLKDDEYLCYIKEVVCPDGCECLTFVLKCVNTRNKNVIVQNKFPFYVLYLKYNEKSFALNVLSKYNVLMLLTMQHNNNVICDKPSRITESIVLDLTYNLINKIESNCFHNATKLKIIRLNNNKITKVHHKAFNDLPVLCYININMKLLSEISPNTINNCLMIYLLTLQNNNFVAISRGDIQHIRVKIILTDNFRICCFVSKSVKCPKEPPWYCSCSVPLRRNYYKFSCYSISFIIIFFSVISVVLQYISVIKGHNKSASFGIVVCWISIADILFAVYWSM